MKVHINRRRYASKPRAAGLGAWAAVSTQSHMCVLPWGARVYVACAGAAPGGLAEDRCGNCDNSTCASDRRNTIYG